MNDINTYKCNLYQPIFILTTPDFTFDMAAVECPDRRYKYMDSLTIKR